MPCWRSSRFVKPARRAASQRLITHAARQACEKSHPFPRYQVEPLERRQLLSTVTWTGTAGDGKWATGGNWSGGTGTGGLPGAGQDVVIPSGFATITASTGTLAINSLSSASPLSFTAGTLSIAAASSLTAPLAISAGQINFNAATSTAAIAESGGVIGGSGALTIGGLFTWSAGLLSVANTTANAGIDFHGTGTDQLSAGTLTNPAGQFATIGATGNDFLQFLAGATFVNAGTLTASSGSMAFFNGSDTFTNTGTFNVALPSIGTFTLNAGITFNSPATGTVNVLSGTLLILDAGTSAGAMNVAGGATLDFQGNYILSSGISGPGTIAITGGTLNAAGPITFNSPLNFSAGTLTGPGPLTLASSFTWSGGLLSVTSTTANAGIDFQGSGTDQLSTGTLTNPAGQTAIIGASGNDFLQFINSATFVNAGTLNASSGSLAVFNGSNTFTNTGTFNVTLPVSDTFTLNAGIAFNNPAGGTVNVKSGTLLILGAGTDAGAISVSSGAVLDFQGNYTLSAGVTGPGTILLTGSTLHIASPITLNAPLNFSAGTLTGPGPLTLANPFIWSGGLLSVTSTIANAGIDFHGDGTDQLSACTLTNPAGQTATIGATGNDILQFINSATFVNAGTLNASSGSMVVFNGSNTFANTGTFNVAEPPIGTFTINFGIAFNNPASGIVNVQSGTLLVAGTGSNSGAMNISSGAVLDFQGNYTLAAGITSPGSVVVTGGTLTIASSLAINAPFSLSGGMVAGPGPLTLSNLFIWSGGILSVTSTTANAGIDFHGAVTDELLNATLINPAGQTATIGASGNEALEFVNNSTFVNAGTLTATSGQFLYFNTTETFSNTGTFNVIEPAAGTFGVSVTLNNTGTVNVQSGMLLVTGGGTNSAALNVANGAVLDFQGNYTLSTGIDGPGTVAITAGTIRTGADPVTINAPLNYSVGTLTGTGALSIQGLFTWSGGILSVPSTTANGGIDFHGAVTDELLNATLTNPLGATATIGASGNDALQFVNNATFVNAGTLTAFSGQLLYFNTTETFTNTGTLNVAATTTGTFTITAGITVNNPGTINVQSGTFALNGTVSNISGPAATATLTGGTWQVRSNSTLALGSNPSFATNAATILLDGSGSSITNATKSANVLAALSHNAAGGSITLVNGQSLFDTPGGGTLTNDGILSLNAGSTLSVAGAFTQPSDGTLAVQLSGAGFGQVSATGAGALGGTLRANLAPAYDPPASTTFAVMTGSTAANNSTVLSGGPTPGGRGLLLRFNSTSAIIAVLPLAPTIPHMTAATDTGASQTDGITKNNTPQFGGAAFDAGAINLYSDGAFLGTAAIAGDGSWIVSVSPAMLDGSHQITAKVVDTAGDAGPLSGSAGVLIDTVAPSIAAQRVTAANANGWNNTNVAISYIRSDSGSGIDTANSDPTTFTFTAEGANQSHTFNVVDIAGNTASASITGVNIDKTPPTLGVTVAPPNPAATGWYNISTGAPVVSFAPGDSLSGIDTAASDNLSPVTLGEGSNVGVSRTVFDKAGNSFTNGVSGLKVDLTAPAAPSTPALSAASDTGIAGDNLTDQTTPTFVGNAEAGSTVTVLADGTPAGSGIATGGSFSIIVSALAPGTHNITARAADLAGNVGPLSGVDPITIDTTPPAVVSTNPVAIQNGGSVAPLSQVQVTFSKPLISADAVAPGNYQLIGAGADGVFGTADDVSYALSPQYTAGGTLVTLNVSSGTLPQGLYRLTLKGSGAAGIQDLAGNLLDGDSNGTPGGDYVRTFTLALPTLDTIAGTSATDTVNLIRDGDGQHINWSLNGGPLFTLPISDPSGLLINSGGGADIINLNYAKGTPLPATTHLNGLFTINGLQNLNGAALDIGRSTVYVNYAGSSDPLSLIRSYLHNGYNGGGWNGLPTAGTGVITTSAGSAVFGIGYADSADGTGINPAPNTVELKYTVFGDANLDGTVGLPDFLATSRNVARTGASWDQGDFNYDGTTNLPDLVTLVRDFGKTAPAAPALSQLVTSPDDPTRTATKLMKRAVR